MPPPVNQAVRYLLASWEATEILPRSKVEARDVGEGTRDCGGSSRSSSGQCPRRGFRIHGTGQAKTGGSGRCGERFLKETTAPQEGLERACGLKKESGLKRPLGKMAPKSDMRGLGIACLSLDIIGLRPAQSC